MVCLEDPPLHKTRSAVRPDLKRSCLIRSVVLGGMGAVLLLFVHHSPTVIFLISIFLISIGLLPYRLLTQLELRPHELHEHEEYYLYFERGRPTLMIPKESIDVMQHIDEGKVYGWAVRLKVPVQKPLRLLRKGCRLKTIENFDLFLPYFTCRK